MLVGPLHYDGIWICLNKRERMLFKCNVEAHSVCIEYILHQIIHFMNM
jgi:hypothetical protein